MKGSDNYNVWSIQVSNTLKAKGVFRYAKGVVPQPVTDTGATSALAQQKVQYDWEDKDTIAINIITLTLSLDIVISTESYTTSKQLWDALASTYLSSGIANKFARYQDWLLMNFDGKNVEKFCSDYKSALLRIASCGLTVNKEIKVFTLLIKVKLYYESFAANIHQQIRNTGEDSTFMKLDTFIDNLLDKHRAQESSITAKANYVNKSKQPNNYRSSNGKKDQKKHKCGRCKTSRHNNDSYWHQHPEKAPQGWKPHNNKEKKQQHNHGKAEPHHAFTTNVASTVSERLASVLLSQNTNNDWIFDSGASTHMTHQLDLLTNYRVIDSIVRIGKGHIKAHGIGSVTLRVTTSKGSSTVTFNNILHVPELEANLLSSETLRNKGLFYQNNTQKLFIKDGTVVAEVQTCHGLPHLRIANIQERNNTSNSNTALVLSKQLQMATATLAKWHLCLGHLQYENISKAKQNSTGMVVKSNTPTQKCSNCQRATAKRIISRVPSQRPEKPYTEVSTNVVTVSKIGINKEQYFSRFTNSTTLYIHQYTTATKDGVKHHFKRYHMYVRTQLDVTIKAYQMDGGCEYGGISLHDFAHAKGINLKITTPHNSESNSCAEISNHIICTTARKLMIQSKLLKGLWPYTLKCAVYLHNITLSDTLQGKSLYQVLAEAQGWSLTVPYLGHLKAYSCVATVLDHDVKRGKNFMPHGLSGQLVGYKSVNIYKIWIPSLHKVIRSTNITFDKASIGATTVEPNTDDVFTVDLAYPPTSSGGEGMFEEIFECPTPMSTESSTPMSARSPNAIPTELLDNTLDDMIPTIGSGTGPIPLPPELAALR